MEGSAADDGPMTTTTREERRIWNPKQRDAAILLESADESGGARSLLEIELSPGGKNKPHRHLTYAERFEVLEGTLTVQLEGTDHRLGPGESALAPAGSLHNFVNETGGTVRYLVELTPGHRGFERSLQVVYGLAADDRTNADGIPRNPLHLALLASWSEIRMPGPYRLVSAVLGVLTKIAERRGVDAELEERYVRF